MTYSGCGLPDMMVERIIGFIRYQERAGRRSESRPGKPAWAKACTLQRDLKSLFQLSENHFRLIAESVPVSTNSSFGGMEDAYTCIHLYLD
jgi:hypothetical protein